uniref:Putative methyltransferase n=1 Tax=viral metagenome TaxID=1070528 RepID=A0A6M3KJ71_9ZZZZ
MERIATVSQILDDIEHSINNELPFSLVRFGDGGLKVFEGYLNHKELYTQHRQEGIPLEFFGELTDGWVRCANEANYVDSPIVYFKDEIFIKRNKTSAGTKDLMSRWNEIHEKVGITNKNYCNPEIGHMLFAKNCKRNLLDIIHDKSICCITNYFEAEKLLSKYVGKVTFKIIPGFFGNHYNVCFNSIMDEIKEEATKYDLWLIGAGELGRLYTGEIKRCGGRTIDIGKVFDAWVRRKLDKRMLLIATLCEDHKLLFVIGNESENIE